MRRTDWRDRTERERGFTLIEALVATTIMTVAVLSIAQITVLSMRVNQDADAISLGVMLAQQKLEQLRTLTWTDDGFAVAPSPSRSLQQNTPGYCDFLDARGQSFASGTSPPPGTAYVRRWAIDALPANPAGTVVLQVLVTRTRDRGSADSDQADEAQRRYPGEVRLVTVKTRKPD
jgi:prepilin-type N-terminal cleavage/methylation domain-containing protein